MQKIIYIRICKNGSSSMYNLLTKHIGNIFNREYWWCNNEEDLSPYRNKIEQCRIIILNTTYQIRYFIQHYSDIWSNAFIFSIIRNPYDRLVSGWKYCYDYNIIPFLFALEISPKTKFLDMYYTKLHWNYYHFTIQQHKLLFIKNVPLTHYIIRLENYIEDTINMFKLFNINLSLDDIPYNNINVTKQYNLTSEEIKIINEKYYKDFELLDYPMI